MMTESTLVDATITESGPIDQNKSEEPVPDKHQTNSDIQWHFG
ncbi:hypothetical protein [Paraburkholderia metrosideri]|jgi:hypothetical protein|uniref:Uncharacterized protein n=1 Tax=Paraburkholderia metrosideri TaxID=580937 RepID=A0ABN7HPW7_9BURK|nr:hypothetical protein LMG28140_02387 [Paraburkholderia metrosideri]